MYAGSRQAGRQVPHILWCHQLVEGTECACDTGDPGPVPRGLQAEGGDGHAGSGAATCRPCQDAALACLLQLRLRLQLLCFQSSASGANEAAAAVRVRVRQQYVCVTAHMLVI